MLLVLASMVLGQVLVRVVVAGLFRSGATKPARAELKIVMDVLDVCSCWVLSCLNVCGSGWRRVCCLKGCLLLAE